MIAVCGNERRSRSQPRPRRPWSSLTRTPPLSVDATQPRGSWYAPLLGEDDEYDSDDVYIGEEDDEHEIYGESSDNGMGDAPTGGYRAVPSDTDTSAVDSDPNAMDGRHKRLGRKRKNFKNHDEAWFMSHDTKKWTAIRFICFWSSILSMLAATGLAVVLIILMPHKCDPNR